MEKYKQALCALLVTASVAGTSQIIHASTNKVNQVNSVSKNSPKIIAEAIIPERTLLAEADDNEMVNVLPQKVMNEKDVLAAKAKEAKLEAEKAEKARLAAEAKKAKLAAEAEKKRLADEKAKLAAKKAATAKKTAAATVKSTTKLVASRSASAAAVSTEKSQAVIDYAKQFMGVRYVFGGASPSGFDCSGFTMYVFEKFGISLPHSASAQSGLGTAVSRNELVPGDLVFFQTYKAGISHVGIYVGGGNFIEAGSNGITITSLSSSYYKPRYKGATRILK